MTTKQTKRPTKTKKEEIKQQTQETKQEHITIEITTDKITTGKRGYFRFTSHGKMITTPFFPTLPPTQEYPYEHHIDDNRLNEMGSKWKEHGFTFFSFDKRMEQENDQYKHLTTTGWEEMIKYELYRLIQSGLLERTVEQDGKQITYRMKWTGEPMEPKQWKTQQPKEKKPKNPKIDIQMENLNFFE